MHYRNNLKLTETFSRPYEGVASGAGKQSRVAYVNLGSYYLIGIPLGVILGYVVKLQVEVSLCCSISNSV